MMNHRKEIAKFLSGAFAWHAITHFGLIFSDALPFTIFGITITPEKNIAGMIVWAILAFLLGYYGWKRKAGDVPLK